MKILFFTQNYPKNYNEEIVSGMVKNPFYLSQYLQKNGCDIKVITYGRKKEEWDFNGIKVYSAGRGFLKGVVKAFFVEIEMNKYFFSLCKKERFDIIHIHAGNFLFLFLLKKLGKIKTPIIYSVHGTSTPELKANIQNKKSFFNFLSLVNGKIQEYIDRFMWSNADYLVSGSDYQIKEMEEIYKIKNEKILSIHNGVDRNHYFPDVDAGKNLKNRLGIAEHSPVVLYVGRVARKKGIHFLIAAIKKILKDFTAIRLVLVLGNLGGQNDYKKEIFDLIGKEDLNKHIIVKKDVPEKDLPSYYNMADLCVFPSTGYESIPTVIYEAMACGKPIITQGSWGIAEVLEKILLSEKEITSDCLAQKILEIINDVEARNRLIKEGLEKIKDFYCENIINNYVDLYEKNRKQ